MSSLFRSLVFNDKGQDIKKSPSAHLGNYASVTNAIPYLQPLLEN